MSEKLTWKMEPVDEMTREDLLIVVHEMAKLMKEDDPRVLRRALEMMSRWYAVEAASDAKIELDGAIELARKELETEA
jgi:hypothetical protein